MSLPITIPPITATLQQLVRAYNINNVVITNMSNPYDGKISQDVSIDAPLQPDSGYNLLGETLGNPVYARVTLMSGKYIDQYGNAQTFPRIDLEGVIVTVNQPKNIVKTVIQGRPGSVKEYIGDSDYNVGISGIITGLNGQFPMDAFTQLKKVLDAQVPIQITSRYLQACGVDYIVVEDYTLDQEAGGYSYQKFSITAISDIAQQIILG